MSQTGQQMEFTLEGNAKRHCLSGNPLRVWPASDLEQTQAVRQALEGLCDGMNAKQITTYFRGGKRTQEQVERVLTGFFRVGLVYITGRNKGYRLTTKK